MVEAGLIEFEISHKKVILRLKKLNQRQLDEFAFEYFAKGEAFQFMQRQVVIVKRQLRLAKDYEGFGNRLKTAVSEAGKLALELYYSLMKTLRERVVETISTNGHLDAKTEEGWFKLFDRQNEEDMQFLMNLADAFVRSHRPDEEIAKNSERASESS